MMFDPDYTAEQHDRLRWLSGIALVIAALVCSGCLLIAWTFALLDAPKKPWPELIGCILILTLLAIATWWMAIRLLRKQRSTNGITTMPETFIQIFGVLFVAGLLFVAIFEGNILISVECLGIAYAMITIRSLIRRKQSVDAGGS